MGELRFWLIVIGIGILVVIYIVEKIKLRREKALPPQACDQPAATFSDEAFFLDEWQPEQIKAEDDAMRAVRDEPLEVLPKAQDRSTPLSYIVVYVKALEQQWLDGSQISIGLRAQGLKFDQQHGVFYYPLAQGESEFPLFKVANMHNPGIFPDEQLLDFSTQGLVFILNLPVPIDDSSALEQMLTTAKKVCFNLRAQLFDSNHHVLTVQGMEQLREKLV